MYEYRLKEGAPLRKINKVFEDEHGINFYDYYDKKTRKIIFPYGYVAAHTLGSFIEEYLKPNDYIEWKYVEREVKIK